MSLINQVLHAVEQRQSLAHGPALKPVLPDHAADKSRTMLGWAGRGVPLLIGLLLLTGLTMVMQRDPSFLAHVDAPIQRLWARLQSAMPVSLPTVLPNTTQTLSPVQTQQASQRIPLSLGDAQPRLERQLIHHWQQAVDAAVIPHADHARAAAAVTASTRDGQSLTASQDPMAQTVPAVAESTVAPSATASTPTTGPALARAGAATNLNNSNMTATIASSKGHVLKQVKPDQSANEWIQRAMDHEQKGRMTEAMQAAKQAVAMAPASEDARLLLSSYQFETGLEAEAVQTLQAGIQAQTDSVALRKALAKWQLGHAQALAGIDVLKPVAASSAQDAEWHWLLAMCYQQSGQHQAALPWFERATSLSPAQAQWLVAYAVSLQAAGQPTQALQQLQAAQNLPMSERMAEFVAQRVQQLSATNSSQ